MLAHRHVTYEGNEGRNCAKIYSLVGALHIRTRAAPEFSQKKQPSGKSLYTSEVMSRIARTHDSVSTWLNLIITHRNCGPS